MGSIIDKAASVVGIDLTGKKGAQSALNDQASAVEQFKSYTGEALKKQEGYLSPFQQAGLGALSRLQSGDLQMDPGYQFRLDEGMKAINAAAAARGMGNSGRTLKELTRFGQDYASQEYGNAFNRQMGLAGLGQNAATNLAQFQGQYGQGVGQAYMGLGNASAAKQLGQSNREAQLTNQVIQGGTAALMFSDERLKTNIVPVCPVELAEMKKHLKAYAFNYISEGHGRGEWVGVMAQDLEKSALGRTLVVENELGQKTIDTNKLLSLFLATQAAA